MDIIIFCGQSNMQGQCERLSNTNCIKNAFEYKFLENKIVPLKNPVGENITYDRKKGYEPTKDGDPRIWLSQHITGSSCYGYTNLVPEFCKEYVSITENQVLAVHITKGSTEISYWLPQAEGYRIILDKAGSAIKEISKNKKASNIFFVWLQGESDAVKGNNKFYYKEKLKELFTALKTDLSIKKFGIIRVGYFTNDNRDSEIISAQDEICSENEDFLMLTDIATTLNTKQEYMNPCVKGHYSAKGLEKLGYEAGKRLGTYVIENT